MVGGVVGGVVLPAVPDDVEPGAGQYSHGVGVIVSAGAGAVVEVGGPGVGSSAVAGKVADRVAELFVGGPTESDVCDLARLAGRGGDPGQAGQRFGGGVAGAAVADLGEQSGGAEAARAGQGGEDVRVGVDGELVGDAVVQGGDLEVERGQCRDERTGDVGSGDLVVGAGSAGQPAVQLGGDECGRYSLRWPATRPGG